MVIVQTIIIVAKNLVVPKEIKLIIVLIMAEYVARKTVPKEFLVWKIVVLSTKYELVKNALKKLVNLKNKSGEKLANLKEKNFTSVWIVYVAVAPLTFY